MPCACDIRIATKDAVFGIRETRMAMIADLGTLQRLRQPLANVPEVLKRARFIRQVIDAMPRS